MLKGVMGIQKLYFLGRCITLFILNGVHWEQFSNLFFMFISKFSQYLHETHSIDSSSCVSGLHWKKMVFIWREREHEEQYLNVANPPTIIQALRYCGLLKFFWLPRWGNRWSYWNILFEHGMFRHRHSYLEHICWRYMWNIYTPWHVYRGEVPPSHYLVGGGVERQSRITSLHTVDRDPSRPRMGKSTSRMWSFFL